MGLVYDSFVSTDYDPNGLPASSSMFQHLPASLSMNWKGIDALSRAGMSVPVCVRRCFVLCSKSSSLFCCVHSMALHPATALF